MMISKKTLFLAVVFSFFLTYGQTKDVVVWHSYRGLEQQALEELRNRFNESQDKYNVVLLSVPYDAFANKLTTAIPRGNGPDGFIFAHERIGDWSEGKVILPVNINEIEKIRDDIVPSTLEAVKYKDKYWGYPLAFKSVVLFYRKDIVEKAPASTFEMVQFAKRYSEPEKGRYGLAFEAASVYFSAPFLYGFGGGFCLEEGKQRKDGEACLNNEGNALALEYISRMVNDHKIVPQEATGALVTQLFNEGQAAMVINGPWFMGEIRKGVPYGVAVLPTVSETGELLRPFLTVESFMVSNHPRTNVDGSRAFANYITSFDGALIRAVTGRQSVATKSVYKDPSVSSDDMLNIFRQQAEIAVPMSNDPKMRMVWEPMATALRKVLRGAQSAPDALDAAQTQYTVFSRPLPEAKSPVVYVFVLIIAAFAALLFVIRQVRKYRFLESVKNSPTPYLYLFPAFFSMILLVFIPFAVGTAVSFFAHRSGEYQFVGFSNFISILLSRDFPITNPLSFYFTLGVTVMWTAVNVFFHVSIGLALALMLREPWLKMKGIYRILLIIPWAVPNYITALIWRGMFNRQFGAINGILQSLGLEPVSWFSSFWTSFAANVTTNTWLGFPFMMVTALGALQAIPGELEDAASVDGANGFERFRHIILPLLKPALLPAVILGSVWTFNMFNIIYLVSGGEPDGGTEILISEAYKWAFQRQERYGYAAAYATLIFIVLLVYSKTTEKVGREKA